MIVVRHDQASLMPNRLMIRWSRCVRPCRILPPDPYRAGSPEDDGRLL